MAARLLRRKALTNLSAPSSSPFSKSSFSVQRLISTLVLGEHEGGSIKAQSLSAVVAAKFLGEDNSISMLLAGSGPSVQEAAIHAASCHSSISQVIVADSDKFTYPVAEPWAKLVQLIQQKGGYSHIMATSGSFGKNILPRAAALLDVSPITDVIEISGPQLFVRPIYAGNALCTVRYTGSAPCMLTVRSTSFPVPLTSANSKSDVAPISQVDPQPLVKVCLSIFLKNLCTDIFLGLFMVLCIMIDNVYMVCKSKYLSHTSQDSERPDLGNARIVVTGGRALKSAENFKMIEKLAEKTWCCSVTFLSCDLILLSCLVGATRAAVDAGFVPNELQSVVLMLGLIDYLFPGLKLCLVRLSGGQTGKIVGPELYLAFGVSGAIQHLAGMRDSKVIVAVNKDADAPIFQVADYGLVGDLFEVIPELLEKLPEKK
ncbi:Electron transfer flavoprotein subunit alpha, mitochondrial [Vitis vinifera]|uniref:Electron transfer flavoprotein subunit alpha n=1 Tax=Vitis vinifera TaxID=29760 RepID=A0A438DXY6_VITVI|nr:Electron transfer flavoprotein subunit alpha, mitochondrial [Vitis vinifera]